MGNREKICRLCLQNCTQNFKNIERIVEKTLEILLPKINLAVTNAPVICTNCVKTLKKCFDFKWACLICTHLSIVSCVSRKDNVKPDLKYSHLIKEENDNTNNIQDPTACGLCNKLSNTCSIVSLDKEEEKMMLKDCFPELDVPITKICVPCHESLLICFHFITKSSIAEEKIQKYFGNSTINDNGVRELKLEQIFCDDGANSIEEVTHRDENVVKIVDQHCHHKEQFTSEGMLRCQEDNTADAIKEEGDFLEATENIVEQKCDNFVKKEDQDFYNERQITAENLFTLEEESNKFDVIKVERECFEEAENKVEYESKNRIEMEEQKSKNFTLKVSSMEVELNQIEIIDPKETFREGEEAANSKVELKCDNFLETENQKFYSFSDFTSNNVMTFEEDCTKFDVSKIEKLCSKEGNDANSENKYLAIMDEEQKYNLNEEVDIKPNLPNSDRFEDGIVLSEVEVDPSKPCINRMSVDKTISEKKNRVHKDTSDVTTYKCDSCSFQTKLKGSLVRHMQIHKDCSELTLYKCSSCLFQSRLKNSLIRHMRIHKDPSDLTIYKCSSCLFQTRVKGSLVRHMLVHKNSSDVTMYNCDICSFQTKRKSTLRCHLLMHKDPPEVPMYNCNICSFQTRHKNNLGCHLLRHKDPSEVTMYKCGSCLFQTKYKNSFISHTIIHKNPSDVTMYNCDFCSFQTKLKSYLNKHLLAHKYASEVPKYNCDFCSFKAKSKRYLTKHMLKHKDPSEVTMYKCGSCLYQTKRKDHLVSHKLIHKDPSDVTMYSCDFCSFQTKYKSDLNNHLLTHKDTSEIPMYDCDFCSFQTRSKNYARRHLLKHKDLSEVTMYKCGFCLYQTKRRDNLIGHMLTHKDPSDVTMYNCDYCSFQTKYKQNLKPHLLTHEVSSKL